MDVVFTISTSMSVYKKIRNGENNMITDFRPPAVPLITVDPYFSIWSCANNLYDDYTRHWTGKPNAMTGIALIDGEPWRFAGLTEMHQSVHPFFFGTRELQGMEQKSLKVKPLSSIYMFEGGGISLEVNFTTPLLMDNLDLMSRPASYISFKACSIDGNEHNLKIYFDVTGESCIDIPGQPDQKAVWGRKQINDNAEGLYMGSFRQSILAKCGDDLRIDWGYLYLVLPGENKHGYISSYKMRKEFAKNGIIERSDDNRKPRDVYDDMPVLATVIELKVEDDTPAEDFIILAYDDIYSIEYFHQSLPAYWRRNGLSFADMLTKSIEEYEDIMVRCNDFNRMLLEKGKASGGAKYADILALAYRQSITAHKLVVDNDGNTLFISKECFSNGCAATVDVSYPSIPIFLLYNTELVKGMLRPIFKFALSGDWPYEFAPHDAGRYPKVNGQVYRLKNGWVEKDTPSGKRMEYGIIKESEPEGQMPVEECGNMLIMAAAIAMVDNNTEFAEQNWDQLAIWANYLVSNGFDPGRQLCTDDFAGHLAHNANLSIKAIIGIGGYSMLCSMMGDKEKADKYIKIAKEMSRKWEELAREEDHYKLTFTDDNTWSLKYNMVWDDIFGLNLFSKEVKEREAAYYLKKKNKYGTPLDNRSSFTKADWLVWAAALSSNNEDFIELIEPLWDFLNESPSRVPFTDWYGTTDRLERSFHHRSVVGGLFIKLLKDKK